MLNLYLVSLIIMQEFRHILFEEEDHVYTNVNTGKKYTSVTQFIGKIKPDVNWDYWAVYKHLQRSGSVRPIGEPYILWNNSEVHYKDYIDEGKKIRAEWKAKGDEAVEKGTFIHLYLENLFYNKIIAVPQQYKSNIKGAYKFYLDHRHLEPVYAELIVADDEFELAGQVDRPFKVAPWVLDIYDYKTDKEIKFENKYSNLKPPCDDLPDCNFSKYTIQLNMYRHIIEKNTKWSVRNLKIVHLDDNDYTIYDVPKYDVTTFINDIRTAHLKHETCD